MFLTFLITIGSIWIQVEGIVGTIRLRIQFIPEAPFVREVTFSFMGVPGG